MNITEDRLNRAKCANHPDGYNRECHICVMRYYHFLLEEYVARYEYEDLERKLRACEARNASLRVELADVKARSGEGRPDWMKRGRIDPARTRR